MTEETQEQPTETVIDTSGSLLQEPAPLDFTAGKPENFPDTYWDADKKAVNIDQLFKDFQNRDKIAKDLRVKLSRGEFTGTAPQDASEYVLELSDELKPIVPDDDPLFNAARIAAKEAGLPKDVFNKFMTPVIGELAKLKASMDAPLTEEQMEAQKAAVEAAKDEEIAKLGPTGRKIVGAIGSHISQLEAGGTFSKVEADALRASLNNADVVRAYNKLRVITGGQSQVPIDMPVDDRASKSDVESKMAAAFAAGNEAEYSKYAAMLSKYNK